MKDVFITADAAEYPLVSAVAGVWEINKLSTGALALFNEDGSIISNDVDVTNITKNDITGDVVEIVLSTTTGTPKVSIPIRRKNLIHSKVPYSAPVAAVKVLGGEVNGGASTYSLNLPSSISAGDYVGVDIVDLSKPVENTQRVKTYGFTAVNTDSLAGTGINNIISKLVSLINNDPNAVVTASANNDGTNNTGIKFIAKSAGNDFAIAKEDGVLKDANIVEYKVVDGIYTPSATTTVIANDVGHGTYAHVAKSEKDLLPYSGRNGGHVLENELWSAKNQAVPGLTYDTYVLIFTPKRDSLLSPTGNNEQLINIFVPTANKYAADAITSGTLVVGKAYEIVTFVSGDDFTNVGASSNKSGVVFVATETTPTTWTNTSSLRELNSNSINYALDVILPLVAE